jgi:hypothetical protein
MTTSWESLKKEIVEHMPLRVAQDPPFAIDVPTI